ncbi:MAG: ATP-binding cassette domain-containing protein [Chitinophagaceae bacterium]
MNRTYLYEKWCQTAIYFHNKEEQLFWLQQLAKGHYFPFKIDDKEKNAISPYFFTALALEQWLEEEYKHGITAITKEKEQLLSSMSAGEQRLALLQYILSNNPLILVLEGLADCLDKQHKTAIYKLLSEQANKICLIQIVDDLTDLLPVFSSICIVNGNDWQQYTLADAAKLISSTNEGFHIDELPAPIQTIGNYPNPLVAFKGVTIAYDVKMVINNINWEINNGEFWQLTGPNGAGKTTLISLITGHNAKAYGQPIFLFGKQKGSGESVWEIKAKIGYVTPNMLQLWSSRQSVEAIIAGGFYDSLGLYQKPGDAVLQKVKAWLAIANLTSIAKKAFADLPLVQQRLVLIIRAMVKHPPLLLLDEPFAGLTINDTKLVAAFINAIAAKGTTAIILVSHKIITACKPKAIYELLPTTNGSVGKISYL